MCEKPYNGAKAGRTIIKCLPPSERKSQGDGKLLGEKSEKDVENKSPMERFP